MNNDDFQEYMQKFRLELALDSLNQPTISEVLKEWQIQNGVILSLELYP